MLEQKKNSQLWVNFIGLYLIGLYCLGCAVFQRYFAQLHIKLPAINFPIFYGEIILLVCFTLLVWKFRDIKIKKDKRIILTVVFFGWVVIKALIGFGTGGAFSFRTAAQFYYLIFAFFGCYLYHKQLFSHKLIVVYFTVMQVTKFLVGTNNFYVLPFVMISFILILKMKFGWWKYLLLIPVLYTPDHHFDHKTWTTLEFFFAGSRARVLAQLGSFVFVFVMAFLAVIRLKKRWKILIVILVGALLMFGLGKFSDKNAFKSMLRVKDIVSEFKRYDKKIDDNRKFYIPMPMSVKLYSKDDLDFNEEINKSITKVNVKKSKEIKENQGEILDAARTAYGSWEQEANQDFLDIEKKYKQKIKERKAEIEKERAAAIAELKGKGVAEDEMDDVQYSYDLKVYLAERDLKSSMATEINGVYIEFKRDFMEMVQEETGEEGVEVYRASEKLLNQVRFNDEKGHRKYKITQSTILFRLFIWRDMIQQVLDEKALFGISFSTPHRSVSIEILRWAEREIQQTGWITAHNSFINMIYRAGIVGLMLIGLFIWLFTKLFVFFVQKKSLVGFVLLSMWVYWSVIANFLVILEFPYHAIPFWTLVGLTIGFARSQGFYESNHRHSDV